MSESFGKSEKPPVPIPWEIGGPIQNQNVRQFFADTIENGEIVIASVLGVGEKTSIGALFGEKAGAALGGDYLLVTDRRVAVIKAGVGTWATGSFGVKTKTFQYDHITSVDVSKGLMFGEIEVVAGGMTEKESGGFFAGASKDSVVQFEKKNFDDVQRLAGRIRELATAARRPASAPAPQDIPDQIRKLSELKDVGILSADEFETKKRELLQRL